MKHNFWPSYNQEHCVLTIYYVLCSLIHTHRHTGIKVKHLVIFYFLCISFIESSILYKKIFREKLRVFSVSNFFFLIFCFKEKKSLRFQFFSFNFFASLNILKFCLFSFIIFLFFCITSFSIASSLFDLSKSIYCVVLLQHTWIQVIV